MVENFCIRSHEKKTSKNKQTEPNRTEPSRTELNWTELNGAKPNQTKPKFFFFFEEGLWLKEVFIQSEMQLLYSWPESQGQIPQCMFGK